MNDISSCDAFFKQNYLLCCAEHMCSYEYVSYILFVLILQHKLSSRSHRFFCINNTIWILSNFNPYNTCSFTLLFYIKLSFNVYRAKNCCIEGPLWNIYNKYIFLKLALLQHLQLFCKCHCPSSSCCVCLCYLCENFKVLRTCDGIWQLMKNVNGVTQHFQLNREGAGAQFKQILWRN